MKCSVVAVCEDGCLEKAGGGLIGRGLEGLLLLWVGIGYDARVVGMGVWAEYEIEMRIRLVEEYR